MIEFVIIIPVLLLLIFGAIQIAFIYSAKTTLNYATFQAARLGATNHASYSAMRRGLVRGMAPLFTNNARASDIQSDIEAGIDSSGSRRDAVSEVDTYTRIIRINPTSAMLDLSGFGQPTSDGSNVGIPNDNLMYRPNWQVDGVSIQDANLLKIRVQYCYKLMVPIVNKIIGSLSELNNQRDPASYREHHTVNDPRFADANIGEVNEGATTTGVTATYQELCGDRADNKEGFVIFAEAIVRMQSSPYVADIDEDFEAFMCDGDKMACP